MSYYPGQHAQNNGYPPHQQPYPQQGGPPPAQYFPPNQQYGGQQYPPPQGPPQGPPPQQGYYYPPQGPPQQGPYPGYPPQQQGYAQYPPQVAQQQQPYMQPSRPPMPSPYPSGFSQQGGAQMQQFPHGKKKALLIGINYFGQKGQLRGCINDVKNMSAFLTERFGYKRDDMVILTDDQHNPISQPTKANIMKAMHWLVKDARPGDALFFHYSGHGGQTEDHDGDEGDGYDETIYPVDFRHNGHIVDDEMHRIMVQSLPSGVRLTAIFDSCHSGSVLDLPYLYSTQGILKEPNALKETSSSLLKAVGAYSKGDVGGVMSAGVGLFKFATVGKKAEEKAKKTRTSAADVVQWSGSKDAQTSADTSEGGQATGAMSYAFISALRKKPQQTYQELLTNIRSELAGKYSQKPQLSCSHPLDTNMPYIM